LKRDDIFQKPEGKIEVNVGGKTSEGMLLFSNKIVSSKKFQKKSSGNLTLCSRIEK
jgi:hypothetical protein